MIVRKVTTVYGLLQMLAEDTEEKRKLRTVLTADGLMPCRRTWERRLHAITTTLPAQIACLGAGDPTLAAPGTSGGHG